MGHLLATGSKFLGYAAKGGKCRLFVTDADKWTEFLFNTVTAQDDQDAAFSRESKLDEELRKMGWLITSAERVGALTGSPIYVLPGDWGRDGLDEFVCPNATVYAHDRYALEFLSEELMRNGTVSLVGGASE